jgi:hypothetical protein
MAPTPDARSVPQVWRIAVLGTAASVPATVVLNWLPDSEATVGGGVMIVGAMIAGALAVGRSVDPDAAGLRAGFLGGIVAILTFVVTGAPAATWSPSRLAFFGFAGGVVLCISPVFGTVSGRVGGRVASILTAE